MCRFKASRRPFLERIIFPARLIVLIWIGCMSHGFSQGLATVESENKFSDTAQIREILTNEPHLVFVNNDSLIKVYEQAYQASVKLNYHFGKLNSSFYLGSLYGFMQNEVLSMKYWQQSIDLALEEKDAGPRIDNIYFNISNNIHTRILVEKDYSG